MDDVEPYAYMPSNSAAVIAFRNAVSDGDMMTVTIDDGQTPPLPDASAPTVTIDAIVDGDEGTTVTLGATLVGGDYDTIAYAWTTTGGTINLPTIEAPTWTRPAVSADTDYTISLTITVTGTGTDAAQGTSDSGTDTETTTVRDATPDASAPTVTIGNVTSVDEGEDLEIVATVSGGTYDTLSLAGVMSSGGGSIGAFAYATGTDDWRATYTAPSVTGDINVQLTVTATATGTGTNAADGTTDDSTDTEGWTVNADTVPSRPAAPTVDQITHESARISWLAPGSGGSPITSYRMRYRVVGSGAGGWVTDDDATSPETITGLDASEDYQVQVRATNAVGNSQNSLNRAFTTLAAPPPALDDAEAPAVTINAITDGDEGTQVTLGATVTGGTYDTLAYAWTANGGTLDRMRLQRRPPGRAQRSRRTATSRSR